ncbi:hypothetical protein [Flavobacterium sp. 3HN19-14]|uniref:hypothetical protein n=1 Tax=Flavobacterium sp. 3HN19-14 TaxID=3448133 RepID=UPI003EE34151
MHQGCESAAVISTACSIPCPTNVTLSTQAEVDDFGVTYAHCNNIGSNLTLSGPDITNVEGLSHLYTIGGDLDFSSTPLLNDLSGFDHLTTIGGAFYYYFQNPAIAVVNAFPALTTVGGNFVVYDCDGLTSFTAANLQTAGGVQVGLNDNMTTLALPSLTTVSADFTVYQNNVLANLDFSGLNSTGNFYFEENNSVTDMSGFSNLQTVNGYFDITNIPLLTSITAFSNLTAITAYIQIEENDAIANLSGLENVNPLLLTGVHINNNPNLAVCNIPGSICIYIDNGSLNVLVANNANGCNSAAEISYACSLNCISYTTWNGVSWSNGVPNADTGVTITGDYTSAGNLDSCSFTVLNNADVTISSGDDLYVKGKVDVQSGTMTFENNANLLQFSETVPNQNAGNIIYKRNAQMRRLDYVYWGAPVLDQNLGDFSPQTVTTRFYTLNETTNSFAAIDPALNDFVPANGYMILPRIIFLRR